MTDERKSFKQLLGSTERRHRVAAGGPIVPAGPPQTLIYELQKQAQTSPRRAVNNGSRIRATFKAVTRAARKRIVVVGLWVLALGVAADFGYWRWSRTTDPPNKPRRLPATHNKSPFQPMPCVSRRLYLKSDRFKSLRARRLIRRRSRRQTHLPSRPSGARPRRRVTAAMSCKFRRNAAIAKHKRRSRLSSHDTPPSLAAVRR